MYYIMLVETDLGLTAVSYHDTKDEAILAGQLYGNKHGLDWFYIFTGDNTVANVFPASINL